MHKNRIAVVLAVGVLAGVLIAQNYLSAPRVEPSSRVVEYLPQFSLPDLGGRQRSIAEWLGRSMIINFWATWCAPCRREMPLLQSLHEESGEDGPQVIGVALDNLSDVRRFITDIGVTYPILHGEHDAAQVAESFGDAYVGLPFSAFVAPGGEIIALRSGELEADYLRRVVAELDAVANGRHSAATARERLRSR